jgi:hypothetical protein
MEEETFGVKRYHVEHGRKKFIVTSYDELPGEDEGWYDSPAKALAAKEQSVEDNPAQTLPPDIAEEYLEATTERDTSVRPEQLLPLHVHGRVAQLLKGKYGNYSGLSLTSFTSLYGDVNAKTKKALKPLYEKVLAHYGDTIKKNNQSKYFLKDK